jgi:predicted ester cyclase
MFSQLEANKEIVRRYIAAFNGGDSAALRELFAPGAQIQGVLGFVDVEKAYGIWDELHAAYAIELTADSMIAEGDAVAVRYTELGTFRSAFRGQQPTGKSYELVAMEWFVIENGKISRRWAARDSASMSRQLAS